MENKQDYNFVSKSVEEACRNWVQMLSGLSALTETESRFLTEFVIVDYRYREMSPHIERGNLDFEYKLSLYLDSPRVKETLCEKLGITSQYVSLLINRCKEKKVLSRNSDKGLVINPVYCFPKDGIANIKFTLSE